MLPSLGALDPLVLAPPPHADDGKDDSDVFHTEGLWDVLARAGPWFTRRNDGADGAAPADGQPPRAMVVRDHNAQHTRFHSIQDNEDGAWSAFLEQLSKTSQADCMRVIQACSALNTVDKTTTAMMPCQTAEFWKQACFSADFLFEGDRPENPGGYVGIIRGKKGDGAEGVPDQRPGGLEGLGKWRRQFYMFCMLLKGKYVEENPTEVVHARGSRGYNHITKIRNEYVAKLKRLRNADRAIDHHAFQNAVYLDLDCLPTGLVTIGRHAFQNCVNLTLSENLPDTVKFIQPHAFENCLWLSLTMLPPEVGVVRECSFVKCYNLGAGDPMGFKLPDQVASIEPNAFFMCGNNFRIRTRNLDMHETYPELHRVGRNAFSGTNPINTYLLKHLFERTFGKKKFDHEQTNSGRLQ